MADPLTDSSKPRRKRNQRRKASDRGKSVQAGTSIDLRLSLDEAGNEAAWRKAASKKLGVAEADLAEIYVKRRSIDARGRSVRVVLNVGLGQKPDVDLGAPHPVTSAGAPVVIVGDGPAGLFCAYELARAGRRSIVLDRGKKVQPRRVDLASLNRRGFVPEESNYCFGEGGAGTFSDGKLYTRAKKRGDVADVLGVLAIHGAPQAILTDARPHIGSSLLPKVVTAMRERLEACGTEFRFDSKVVDLLVEAGHIRGVKLESGDEVLGEHVVLATGHSGRDVWHMLHHHGVELEEKAFALGVRIEHPQALINELQYGKDAGHPALPAAAYSWSTQANGHGVFSFCMCPGGFIVPASTEEKGLVVNGMSLTKRASPFANSGLVVTVEPSAWKQAGFEGVFGGVRFQRSIEQAAFSLGGGALVAPATRLTDFLKKRASSTVPKTSYRPGILGTNIESALDAAGVSIAAPLRAGLKQLTKRMPTILTEEGVLLATESRTSAPIRVPRDPETLDANIAGLYPAGEGAGYAGGIMSAALDGMRIARRILLLA